MSLYNPGLDLYDVEPCRCENCKANEREIYKAEKRTSKLHQLVERLDEIVRRNHAS